MEKITEHKTAEDYRKAMTGYLIGRIKASESALVSQLQEKERHALKVLIRDLKTQISIIRDDLI